MITANTCSFDSVRVIRVDRQSGVFRARIEVVAMDGFGGYKHAATSRVPDAVTVSTRSTSSPWPGRSSAEGTARTARNPGGAESMQPTQQHFHPARAADLTGLLQVTPPTAAAVSSSDGGISAPATERVRVGRVRWSSRSSSITRFSASATDSSSSALPSVVTQVRATEGVSMPPINLRVRASPVDSFDQHGASGRFGRSQQSTASLTPFLRGRVHGSHWLWLIHQAPRPHGQTAGCRRYTGADQWNPTSAPSCAQITTVGLVRASRRSSSSRPRPS